MEICELSFKNVHVCILEGRNKLQDSKIALTIPVRVPNEKCTVCSVKLLLNFFFSCVSSCPNRKLNRNFLATTILLETKTAVLKSQEVTI